MIRLPRALRTRLVLLFAGGTTAVVLASTAVLWFGLSRQLDDAIEAGLRQRADDMAALVADDQAIPPEETFAQLIAADGTLLETSVSSQPVLQPHELAAAATAEVVVDRPVPGLGSEARLLAQPVQLGSGPAVIVVGSSLDPVIGAEHRLALLLGVGSPLLIAAVAAAGWWLAGAALAPVERMRRQAETISTADLTRRLPVARTGDEIERLGATLNAMLARIEDAVAHERTFLDDASHELRTPVAILRAELELALAEPGGPADLEAALRSALEETDRLTRLTDDLLVLARSRGGTVPMRLEPVDLLDVVDQLVERMGATPGPPVERRGHSVRVDADRAQLERLLANLISNARRHAATRVLVAVDRQDRQARVVVADDGPGFSPDILPVAFDRFSRADHARGRGTGGTGLGLAIAADIAASHGGTLSAANGPPCGGAVVTLLLPAPGT